MQSRSEWLDDAVIEDDPGSGPTPDVVAELDSMRRLSEAEAALPDRLAAKLDAYLVAVDERESQLAALIV